MQYTDIRFPHLGIVLSHVGRYISIGNFQIMFYGIIIACGFLAGLVVAQQEAKRTGQNPEIYMDYLLWMMIPAIIGARIYYVVFSWDAYKDNIPEIFNLRHGGLGIVGGVIMAIIVLLIFAKVRKQSALLMLDTMTMGLLLGQIMGRWGNFFNREAFGGYTNGPLAMQIPLKYFEQYGRVSELKASGILDHLVTLTVNGEKLSYIQVHPTFLYESLWNVGVLLMLLLFTKHKKFHGEIFLLYLAGYGIGRFWIEGLRTDQLLLPGIKLPVSQVLSAVVAIVSIAVILIQRKRCTAKKTV